MCPFEDVRLIAQKSRIEHFFSIFTPQKDDTYKKAMHKSHLLESTTREQRSTNLWIWKENHANIWNMSLTGGNRLKPLPALNHRRPTPCPQNSGQKSLPLTLHPLRRLRGEQ